MSVLGTALYREDGKKNRDKDDQSEHDCHSRKGDVVNRGKTQEKKKTKLEGGGGKSHFNPSELKIGGGKGLLYGRRLGQWNRKDKPTKRKMQDHEKNRKAKREKRSPHRGMDTGPHEGGGNNGKQKTNGGLHVLPEKGEPCDREGRWRNSKESGEYFGEGGDHTMYRCWGKKKKTK